MKTIICPVLEETADAEKKRAIAQAAAIIQKGGLVAFPTETVYGLGADAFQEDACARIYEAKGRPSDNPLIIHIAEKCALKQLTDTKSRILDALADAFWPGPLTVIVEKSKHVPLAVTGGRQTVAVRLPSHPVAQALIRSSGGFIAAPSANASGRPSPTSAAHVAEDLDGRIDMILDGGNTRIGLESTIVDLTSGVPRILRPGMTEADALRKVLKSQAAELSADNVTQGAQDTEALAPGMKYRHYAPKAPMTLVEGEKEAVVRLITERIREAKKRHERTGVIASEETADCYQADVVLSLGKQGDLEEAARLLYRTLREMDAAGAEVIFCESFPGEAMQNRLYKAAGGRVIRVST